MSRDRRLELADELEEEAEYALGNPALDLPMLLREAAALLRAASPGEIEFGQWMPPPDVARDSFGLVVGVGVPHSGRWQIARELKSGEKSVLIDHILRPGYGATYIPFPIHSPVTLNDGERIVVREGKPA